MDPSSADPPDIVLDTSGPKGRLATAGLNLLVENVAGEVVRCFNKAEIPCLLLKGPAIARWLYLEGERRYGDVDLLVRLADLSQAEAQLTHLGFQPSSTAAVTSQHSKEWVRESGPPVDLHTRIWGATVAEEEQWALLTDNSSRLEVGGASVATPRRTGLLLHIVLHAAQHGPRDEKPLRDLERVLTVETDLAIWREALNLARSMGAVDAFSAGLRTTNRGRTLAQTLAVAAPQRTEALIHLQEGDIAPALRFEQLLRQNGMRARIRMILRGVAPSRSYMARRYPWTNNRPLRLGAAYISRPIWFRWRFVSPGFGSWRRARANREDGGEWRGPREEPESK